jgi:hypothetical protein
MKRLSRKWIAALTLIGIVNIAVVADARQILSDGTSSPQTFSKNVSRIEIEEKEVYTVEEVEITDDTNHDITEDDIDLLARLITSEEGYASDFEIGSQAYENVVENYYLCGSVVINRMNHNLFPDTLEGVIYQRGQYAVVLTGAINKTYDDIAWEIAEELLTYGTEIPSNVLGQAQFKQMDGVYKQVGNQIYSYLE